jgi:hypothetical protein
MQWKKDLELGPASGRGLHCDVPAVLFRNTLGDR